MIKARSIHDETIIYEIEATSNVKNVKVSSTNNHNTLYNRTLPDQHPISAITGLEDALNRADTFVYEQGVASDTWVIVHNLGKYPSVTAVDSAGNVQIPDEVQYDSENQITVQFIGSFAGKAFLN